MSSAAAAPTTTTKIATDLLRAVQADPQVEADIMVQLESPEQVMQRACGDAESAHMDRAQKTTCMVDNLQSFADASQQEVKDLLAQHTGEFADSTFFWINNSVSVKKAKGTLVLALAGLETVLQVRPEQIFHTMQSQGDDSATQQPPKRSMGLGVMH